MTTIIDNKVLTALANCLQEAGLNLATALPVTVLSPEIWWSTPIADGGTILLLGNGGQDFWQKFTLNIPAGDDPVDIFSAEASEQVLEKCCPGLKRKLLFPTDECPVLLQRLMLQAGWHTPSPLGIGMHAEYGLWNACRAVWWLDAELEQAMPQKTVVDHCAHCVDTPCMTACPAKALGEGRMPLLNRCADYRLSDDSVCEQTCVAREACPVATEHRYTAEQLSYHYGLARSAIARYRSGANSSDGE